MRFILRRYSFIPTNNAEEARVVPIIADAAIATAGVGHGRHLRIIVDATKRPDRRK